MVDIEEYKLTVESSSLNDMNKSLILTYRGNENIMIESKNDKDSQFILVPRDILTKFLDMIR